MELPPALRRAVDRALEAIPLAELQRASETLSERYRAERCDGRAHLADDMAVRAYLATRLPATYAAIRAALAAVAEVRQDFAPVSMLDAGAGPGTAAWAAAECWPGLADALLIEQSAPVRAWGERLMAEAPVPVARWRTDDLLGGLPGLEPRDLVVLGYVLDELPAEGRDRLIDRLWALTGTMLVIVEPGTPSGWQRLLAARERLLAAGACIVAPCPHAGSCPVALPDWCHFSRRVARSALHRRAKQAELSWEDEKYVYLAVSRHQAKLPRARVLARPRAGRGRITLKLCRHDGIVLERQWTRRDGEIYKAARRLDWGAALPTGVADDTYRLRPDSDMNLSQSGEESSPARERSNPSPPRDGV